MSGSWLAGNPAPEAFPAEKIAEISGVDSNGKPTSWKTVDVLTTTNTAAFTPTADYHPATKKYVDDHAPSKTSELENDSNYITAAHIYNGILISSSTPNSTKKFKITVDNSLFPCYTIKCSRVERTVWGYSSAGRALDWQSRGQRFDPAYLHQSGALSILNKCLL